jgi:hypothetical protein
VPIGQYPKRRHLLVGAIDWVEALRQNSRQTCPTLLSMFESLRPPSAAPGLHNYIQPNLGHGLRIWWAFFWPTALISIALVAAVNAALVKYWENSELSPGITRTIVWTMRLDGYFFYYVVAFFILAYILRKNFRTFRIGLLAKPGSEHPEPLRPAFRRTVRVWWTYSWRASIYRIVVAFVASFPLGWIIRFLGALFRAGHFPGC